MSIFQINPATTSTGGGTPGGSNGDIQYNNAGAFGGVAIVPPSKGGIGQPANYGFFGSALSPFNQNTTGTTGACVTANNQVRAVRIFIPALVSISRATLTVVATAAAATFATAFYDSSKNKLLEFGTYNGNSATTQSLTATPVSFTGGEYWFAWSNSNTAVTVQATAPNNTLGAIVGATNGNFGTAANAYSGGMPASLGAITNITSSINIPLIFFEVS